MNVPNGYSMNRVIINRRVDALSYWMWILLADRFATNFSRGLILSCAIAALVSNAHFSKCPITWYQLVPIKCLHTIVVCFRLLCVPYSEQVEDIEHYNASIGGEFDAKMNSFKHIKWFLWNFGKLNSAEQVLEMNFDAKMN